MRVVLVSSLLAACPLAAITFEVGPGRAFAAPCAAMRLAGPGDTVEVRASGNYDGDVCTIERSGFTVRGVEGRPHIRAAGRNAAGKGIWVIGSQVSGVTVENIEFSGATVPDKNGAAIRVDPGGSVTIRDCHIHDNENGLLSGDGGTITIEYSIFENNGFGDGQSHNVYVNHADRFVFRGNWSRRSKVGHLLKSRAKETHILYNRLSQEDGTGSREIDLPNGGLAYVIGNVIQQGRESQNSNMLGYKFEGAAAAVPVSELHVVNNTFVNQNPGGTFVQVADEHRSPIVLRNNVFFGPGIITNQPNASTPTNYSGDPGFANVAQYDLTLRAQSPAVNAGSNPGSAGPVSLTPVEHYKHPACGEARRAVGAVDIGAYELTPDPGAPLGPARCAAPVVASVTVVHGATFQRGPLAPGSIAAVFGTNLAASTVINSSAVLPPTIEGVRVTVNALPAPLFFVSPEQVNFQTPYGLDLGESLVELRVNNEVRAVVRQELAAAAPGIFLQADRQGAIAQNEDFALNGAGSPAAAGSYITVYLTGQGRLTTFLQAGEPARALPLAEAALPKSATLGGRPADLLFLGMTPGLVGVAQANLRVPEDLAAGPHALVIRVGGVDSNAARVVVARP